MIIRKFGFFPQTEIPINPESGGTHPYPEILYISDGPFLLEWLGEKYEAEGPCLFLFASNTPHSLAAKSNPLKYLYWELEMTCEKSFPPLPKLFQWNAMQGKRAAHSVDFQLLFRSLDVLGELMKRSLFSRSTALQEAALSDISKILLIIEHILQQIGVEPASMKSEVAYKITLVESLMRYLETNYKEKITLQSLSRLFHVSGSYLIRLFHEQRGQTPFQYLDQLRLTAAESYLLNTHCSIQEITELMGFTSIHYFSRHFKNHYGVSPSVWRRINIVQQPT